MNHPSDKTVNDQRVGLIALVAIVVSSMIGSGVDSLPQNMAEQSSVGAVAIAWLVCGFGMYFVARVFVSLSDLRPDLQAGIYMYAREGFGPLAAFLVAWGYWLMTIFSNVAFAVMSMDVLNYFMPGKFAGGNNFSSIVGASLLIWGFHFLVLSGTKLAGTINTIGTIAKLIPLAAFVGAIVYFLDYTQLTMNVWGHEPVAPNKPLGSTLSQVLSPLYVALWCFIGIEGAVALSGRARNKGDVGRATLMGFSISLVICMLISVLPFGLLSQSELSQLANPSTAGVMKNMTGDWGEWLINAGVLISILASWLVWTMICAEIPMVAAENGTFPAKLARKNKNGAASTALWVSTFTMQIVVLVVHFAHNAWLTLLAISAIAVLPAYFASAAYLAKLCMTGQYRQYGSRGVRLSLFSSLVAASFCLFMLYASQIQYVALTPILLTFGLPFYIWAKKQDPDHANLFTRYERIGLIALFTLDLLVVVMFWKGVVVI